MLICSSVWETLDYWILNNRDEVPVHDHYNQSENNYHNGQQDYSSIQGGLYQRELRMWLVPQAIPRGKIHGQSTRVLLEHSKKN